MFDQVGKFQMGLVGAGLGALTTFLVVSNVWFQRGYDAASLKANAVIAKKNETIVGAEADISQCQTANASYFKQAADQYAELNRRLDATAAEVAQANKNNAAADKRMMDAAVQSVENFTRAREAMANAVDQCIRSNVPADFVGLFNDAFRTAANSQTNGHAGGAAAGDH